MEGAPATRALIRVKCFAIPTPLSGLFSALLLGAARGASSAPVVLPGLPLQSRFCAPTAAAFRIHPRGARIRPRRTGSRAGRARTASGATRVACHSQRLVVVSGCGPAAAEGFLWLSSTRSFTRPAFLLFSIASCCCCRFLLDQSAAPAGSSFGDGAASFPARRDCELILLFSFVWYDDCIAGR